MNNTDNCPRCGNLYIILEQDKWGAYENCFQCGWVREILDGEPLIITYGAKGKRNREPSFAGETI